MIRTLFILLILVPTSLLAQSNRKWVKDSTIIYENIQLGDPHFYSITIDSVYDGDTYFSTIKALNGESPYTSIRLFGVQAPEVRGLRKKRGKEIRDIVIGLLEEEKLVVRLLPKLDSQGNLKYRRGKYGRLLGIVYVVLDEGLFNFNAYLIKSSLAKYKSY